MEVEVKLRLETVDAYNRLLALFDADRPAQIGGPLGKLGERHEQVNYFFEGSHGELEAKRSVLRVRIYDVDKKATITLKGKMVIDGGVGRAAEMEESIPPKVAHQCVADPSMLTDPNVLPQSEVMAFVKQTFGPGIELSCLGSFSNTRQEVAWGEHLLEIDATKFDWGTLHELEAETAQPDALKAKLEQFLGDHQIQYSYSKTSKFANFRNKTLL